MRKLGFIIGMILLLIAVMPVGDNLPAQAAEPPVPQEVPRLPPPPQQQPPPVIDGHGTGFIAPTMDLSHVTGQRMPDGSLVRESPVGQPPPPASFDWRTQGKVTLGKNQGGYGSCYAFASVANLESKVSMRTSASPSMNCTCGDICVNESGWWRDGSTFTASSTPIQDAVDNATSGDTICVKDGTYHENVDVVTSQLSIQSENGAVNCVLNSTSPNAPVFNVTADRVNITGFTVENATEVYNAGICLSTAAHCNVSDSNVINNYRGIYLHYSSNNTLANNSASDNSDGIYLYYSSNNTFTNNTATNNYHCGIYLYYSSNNTFTNNTASNNDYQGVWLDESSKNTLTNNTASDNDYGILLYSSSNNTLTNNTASNNSDGIYLHSSSNNTIYNNYFNNTNNAYDDGNSAWNTTKTPGINIIGGHYLGGNYWSDYSGNDTNRDGIGDTPYNITGGLNKDYLPLTTPAFIDVVRNLPDTVRRGETFNVTVTFTAPEDKFNSIGLTDLCPDDWNVIVNKTWCTPTADAVLATGNKAEIAWCGEPGVGFDNGTSFSALYKVTVPDYAPLGIHTFSGVLEYYLAGEGPYCENVIGDCEIEVIGATLEGHVGLLGLPATSVTVRFFDPGTHNETMKKYGTTDSRGNFTIGNLIPGTYDVAVKGQTSLSNLVSNVTFITSTYVDFGVLLEGDANGDDYVDGDDFGPLSVGWHGHPGASNWNPDVDFSRDGYVDGSDFGRLSVNWHKYGDCIGWPGSWL